MCNKFKKGQYWLVEGGSVALILEPNSYNNGCLCNRVFKGSYSCIDEVGVSHEKFETQLTLKQVKKFVDKWVNEEFDFQREVTPEKAKQILKQIFAEEITPKEAVEKVKKRLLEKANTFLQLNEK